MTDNVSGEMWSFEFDALGRLVVRIRIACGFNQSSFCFSIISRIVLVKTWKSVHRFLVVTYKSAYSTRPIMSP
jgi:hypothetical protein